MERFGERLKKFRLRSKISQRESARRIGVPESTYREWEYGRAIRDHKIYPKIAQVFQVTLEELFGVSTTDQSLDDLAERISSDAERLKKLVSATSRGKTTK